MDEAPIGGNGTKVALLHCMMNKVGQDNSGFEQGNKDVLLTIEETPNMFDGFCREAQDCSRLSYHDGKRSEGIGFARLGLFPRAR